MLPSQNRPEGQAALIGQHVIRNSGQCQALIDVIIYFYLLCGIGKCYKILSSYIWTWITYPRY